MASNLLKWRTRRHPSTWLLTQCLQVTLESFVLILTLFNMLNGGFDVTMDVIGREPQVGEEEWITNTRDLIIFLDFLVENIRGTIFTDFRKQLIL